MTPTVLIKAIPKEGEHEIVIATDEHETVIATVSNEKEDEIVPESNESPVTTVLGCLIASTVFLAACVSLIFLPVYSLAFNIVIVFIFAPSCIYLLRAYRESPEKVYHAVSGISWIVGSLVLFFASIAIAGVSSLCMLFYIPNAYVSLFGLVAQLLVGSVGYGWLKGVDQAASSWSVHFILAMFGDMLSFWLMATSQGAMFVLTMRKGWWLVIPVVLTAPVALAMSFGGWVINKCEGCGLNNRVGISQADPQREGAQIPEIA